MRRGVLLILLILFLLMVSIGIGRVTGLFPREPARAPVAPFPDDAVSDPEPEVALADPAESPATAGAPRAGAAAAKGGIADPLVESDPVVIPEDRPAADAAPTPAFRRNPRTPPPPKPGSRVGGGRPPMGPTGLWERFPPEVPSGTASLRVRVVDRDGVPVPGAEVWLGPPDIAGLAAVSFGDLQKAGVTDAAGVAFAGNLPAGSAAVAANAGNLLNGPRGLDAGSAVRTVLKSDETVLTEVRLPIDLSDYARIHGVVTGPEDRPLSSVSVTCGFQRARTDASGRYELQFVPAGTARISAGRSGYRSFASEVTVTAGEDRELDVSLGYQEEGSLHLIGTVVGPDGSPVPAAAVYVIARSGAGSGTVRSGSTDEHGRFEFRALPDRLATADVRLQASHGGYQAGSVQFPDGLKRSEAEIRLPVQQTNLRLTVQDAQTGAPQTRCRFTAMKEGQERAAASFSSRSPTGVYETWLEPGRHSMVIEAPDHETLTAVVEIPAGGGDFPYLARLVANGEECAEVVLTVQLVSAITGDPIERADIRVIGPDGETPVAGLEGERPGGVFQIPVPSGNLRIEVKAEGYEFHAGALHLPPAPRAASVRVALAPD